jgi:hypothetical protein
MKSKVCLGFFLVLLTGVYGFAVDIGNYRIPETVTYAGKTVEPGTYTIQLEDGAEGMYLQLTKGGTVVAKDLAIVIPASGPGKTSVQIARITGQEFLRIRVRSGDNWYYAYLERKR